MTTPRFEMLELTTVLTNDSIGNLFAIDESRSLLFYKHDIYGIIIYAIDMKSYFPRPDNQGATSNSLTVDCVHRKLYFTEGVQVLSADYDNLGDFERAPGTVVAEFAEEVLIVSYRRGYNELYAILTTGELYLIRSPSSSPTTILLSSGLEVFPAYAAMNATDAKLYLMEKAPQGRFVYLALDAKNPSFSPLIRLAGGAKISFYYRDHAIYAVTSTNEKVRYDTDTNTWTAVYSDGETARTSFVVRESLGIVYFTKYGKTLESTAMNQASYWTDVRIGVLPKSQSASISISSLKTNGQGNVVCTDLHQVLSKNMTGETVIMHRHLLQDATQNTGKEMSRISTTTSMEDYTVQCRVFRDQLGMLSTIDSAPKETRINSVSADGTSMQNVKSVVLTSEGIYFTDDVDGGLYFGSSREFRIVFRSNPDRCLIQSFSTELLDYEDVFEVNSD
jgi:hypothetical protein